MESYLDSDGLPDFQTIDISQIQSKISDLITVSAAQIDRICSSSASDWDSVLGQLEKIEMRLEREWSPVRHLNSVVNSRPLREAYTNSLPLLTEYFTNLSQNSALYQKYLTLRESAAFKEFDHVRQKVICNGIRDFRLAGIDLERSKQQQVKSIQQKLAELQNLFKDNVLDATQGWQKELTSEEELSGIPDSGRALLQQAAQDRNHSGWMITLDAPVYLTVMSHANSRELREQVYRAYMTRATQGTEWNNDSVMEEILGLRFQLAKILGFAHYAEYSLQTKMAESVDAVEQFLLDLAAQSSMKAKNELHELQQFAKEHLHLEEINPWDLLYVSERFKEENFQFSQEELKPYFPVDRVIDGLFTLCSRLFGVQFIEKPDQSVWHQDVRFYEVIDENGKACAAFYLDLYARQHKQGGAWMDVCRNRGDDKDGVVSPVAYMTCNASPPTRSQPALFTHQEIVTLFHEFGHGLHHMLTQVNCSFVAGINGVEWDAVEAPSQFMENWCWDRQTLTEMSEHYRDHTKLPDELYSKLLATKTFNSGLQMLRQIEFALFDLRLHSVSVAPSVDQIQQILEQVRSKVSLIRTPKWTRFQNSFSHIFGGGYAAGYYSYKWAEVLSADLFSAFEENPDSEREVGNRLRSAILANGGSRNAMELFEEFRGRKPSIDPLLRHSGIK